MMKRWRFFYLVFLAMTGLAAFAGCNPSGQAKTIETLPGPIVHTPTPLPTPSPSPPVPSPTGRELRETIIIVDPGHGGTDPGALARFAGQAAEKTINLDIGLRVGRLLMNRGARVTMTRNRDTYPELSDRAALAERLRADLFVSIHCNSASPDASGVLVLIYEHASPQSQKAAARMVEAFRRAGIDCQIKDDANLHVLREHSRPAMLIECRFLTNRAEAQLLNSPAYRERLASVIADGVAAYFAP